MRTLFLAATLLLFVSACSGNSDSKTDTAADQSSLDSSSTDLASDSKDSTDPLDLNAPDVPQDVLQTPYPMGFEERGFQELRGVVHLHSAFSHDGCAPDGFEDFGGPDPACNQMLRDAACTSGMSFLMMSDHPGHLREFPYEEGIHYSEADGDELLLDDQERPFSNRMHCPEGSAVDTVLFYYGTEGFKFMPIAMAGPVPPEVFSTGYQDEVPLEEVQAVVATTHELGGFAWGVHTEESTISEQRIVEIPLDGMEIYNLHSNLMEALKSLDDLFTVNFFMDPTPGSPNPDLALLLFLQPVSEDQRKYDYAIARTNIACAVATDIHQNVEIPSICPDGAGPGSLCEPFVEEYPYFTEILITGGPAFLSDGDRMDSWKRSFRWFSNHAIVLEDTPEAIRASIGSGQSYSVFEMFGMPGHFDFHGATETEVFEMGTEHAYAEGQTLRIMTPTLEVTPWWEEGVIDPSQGIVTTRLIRATVDGAEVMGEWEGQGKYIEVEVPGPGAYRVEVDVTPKHLIPMLSGVIYLASKPYPYIYTNTVFLR